MLFLIYFLPREMRGDYMEVQMKKGDLLADLVGHFGISRTLVKLHGLGVHERLMGLLMSSGWDDDADVHFYLRPDCASEDGVMIELELARDDGPWRL